MRSTRVWLFGLLVAAVLPFLGTPALAGKGGNKGGGGGGGGGDGGGGTQPASEIAFFATKGDKLVLMDADGENPIVV